MKKTILLIIIASLEIYSVFGNDSLVGVWALNIFSVKDDQKKRQTFSWGDGYEIKTKGFVIDKDSNGLLFININGFGKFSVVEIEETENKWYISFLFNSGEKEMLVFKKINDVEICIEGSNKTSFLPSGDNNRYFKIQGMPNSNVLILPIIVQVKENTPIKWNTTILGYLNKELNVEVIGVSNEDVYSKNILEKKYLIKIEDEHLQDYNEEFYFKQNLIKDEKITYGYIVGSDIKSLEKFNLQ